jgi:hypothetical protein
VRRFTLDQREKALAHVARSDDELSVVPLARKAGEKVEQVAQIGPNLGIAGEQAEVRVLPRRL